MMVRLIVQNYETKKYRWRKFQFHDGAIDSKSFHQRPNHSTRFQFHDGAIDSVMKKWLKKLTDAFQFHDGAIDRTQRENGR